MSTRLGTILKEARSAKRMTLRKLGEFVGIAPSFLSEVENGIRPAPLGEDFWAKITQALQIGDAKEIAQRAQEEHELQRPKRFNRILQREPELAASFYRLSSQIPDDDKLAEMFLQVLKKMEEDKHAS